MVKKISKSDMGIISDNGAGISKSKKKPAAKKVVAKASTEVAAAKKTVAGLKTITKKLSKKVQKDLTSKTKDDDDIIGDAGGS
jgi:hypothetical protein